MAIKLNKVDEIIASDNSVLNISNAVSQLSTPPDMSQYYTKGEVDTQISNIDIGVTRSESANYIDFTFA